jgi:4-amino-4-deoxy-L-arabinose transferase-like glycosyltransferase
MVRDRYPLLLTIAGLSLIVAIGGYLRFFDLATKSISHPEMYVPGIRMPVGLSEPHERLTLLSVLTGTFSSDTHPPGYYLLMWGWTKLFGASLWSIRLPSALLGIASILLVFWLGIITRQKQAGWIAAMLLAFNGYHVFWSKVSRMFSLACFLGLLATILLILLARDAPARRPLSFLYAMVILLGVASHIFFWSLLLTHIIWVGLPVLTKRQTVPGLLKLQMMLLILGSPLLVFAVYQSGNTLAVLSSDVTLYFKEFVQFSYLFPIEKESAVYPAVYFSVVGEFLRSPGVRDIFFLFSLFLLFLGLASGQPLTEKLLSDPRGPSPRMSLAAGVFGVLIILTFISVAKTFLEQPNETIRSVTLLVPLPFLIAMLPLFFHKWHRQTVNWRFEHAVFDRILDSRGIIYMLAIFPFAFLAVISYFTPILNQRGMVFMAPYLLFVLALGLVYVSRRRTAAIALSLLLLVLSFESIASYSLGKVDPLDFHDFSRKVTPRIERTDLIFLQRSWYGTPILYYFPQDRYQLVGNNYLESIRKYGRPRVWVLSFYTETVSAEIEHALGDYRRMETIEVPHARAVLYLSEGHKTLGNETHSEASPPTLRGRIPERFHRYRLDDPSFTLPDSALSKGA